MFKTTCVSVIGFSVAALTTPVLAQDATPEDVPPVTDAPDGENAVMRGVQGPAGLVSARVLLDINLSDGLAGQPISLAPDLHYSVTDTFQLGLLHTGPMGWQARPGVGLCLTGEDNGCPDVYDNVGFDAMYGLVFGKAHLSAHASLFLDSFDPTTANLALGFVGKLHFSDKAALFFDPKIAIALNDRDTQDDAVYIPFELGFQAAPKTSLKLLTGVLGRLSDFGDSYEIPVGIGVVQNLSKHFDLGARFSFDNLLGAELAGVGRADSRSLAVLVNIRS
jgi:hypothetical protein